MGGTLKYGGRLMIREANLHDLEQIATIHTKCFDNRFLAKLGPELLAKYYKEFVDDQNIFLVSIDEEDNAINGFILGTPHAAVAADRFVKNNAAKLSLKTLLLLFKFDRVTWISVLRTAGKSIKRMCNRPNVTSYQPGLKMLSLHSICVSNEFRRQGIARALIGEFEEKLVKKGYEGYRLSVKKENKGAIHFYTRVSMSVCGETNTRLQYEKLINL
jgi:ribosomal protein S18 acetylase RimI-like enzyme